MCMWRVLRGITGVVAMSMGRWKEGAAENAVNAAKALRTGCFTEYGAQAIWPSLSVLWSMVSLGFSDAVERATDMMNEYTRG